MKTRWMGWGAAALVCAAGLAVVMVTGCDQATNLEGLEIDPAYVQLTPESNVVEFVISTNSRGALSLPIRWHVTDASLGRISGTGYRALYVRFAANGQNTVVARDEYDNEGYATIDQIAAQYDLTLTANPATIPAGAAVATITASDGQAPYTWTVYDPNQGYILGGQGSATAIYFGNGPGVNVVTVTDAFGVTGSILIEQE